MYGHQGDGIGGFILLVLVGDKGYAFDEFFQFSSSPFLIFGFAIGFYTVEKFLNILFSGHSFRSVVQTGVIVYAGFFYDIIGCIVCIVFRSFETEVPN